MWVRKGLGKEMLNFVLLFGMLFGFISGIYALFRGKKKLKNVFILLIND